MFFALALTSTIGYSLQNALLVRYARKMDGLSLAFYRNISFLITLLPLLAFSSAEEIELVLSHWRELVIAGISGGVCLGLLFTSYRFISVGVSHTVGRASNTVLMTTAGIVLYGEVLPPLAFLLIALIVAACIWLALQRVHSPHITQKLALGITLSLASTLPLLATKIAITDLSRMADPFTSAYFWEAAIAIATLTIILLRRLIFKKGLQHIPSKDVLGIAACSSPTLVGSGCFALALSMGPVAIVSAVGSGSLFVTAFLAWYWYHEKLSRSQWAAMLLIVLAIVLLKFV